MIDLEDGVPGVNAPEPKNFEEFWPFYLSQHLHPTTRAVHAAATCAAITLGVAGVLSRRPRTLMTAPLVVYGPAFASHFIWEKNRPATISGYPKWSVGGDMRMLWRTLNGTIYRDVQAIREALGMSDEELTLADRNRRVEQPTMWPDVEHRGDRVTL